MSSVRIPDSLTTQELFHLALELDHYELRDDLNVVFSAKTFFSPFSMLFIASKLKSIQVKNPDLRLRCSGHADHPYPAHVGFFRFLGFDHGRDVGEAWGSSNYIPITELTREQLIESPDDRFQEVPDLIQKYADRIASVISRDVETNQDMFDVLSYTIREVMRNVFEHGETDRLFFCAQYWPKSKKVEFAVVDFGIGIRRGLGTNPNFRFATDKEAIEYSLLPSVSGKTHLPRRSNVWFNSGYGLYMTNRLARNGGNFVIASRNTAIYFTNRTKMNYETSFPGTALRMNIDVAKIGGVQARLEEFRKEGYQIAKTIAGSGNRPPSAMSLLLRRDYATAKS
jgi:hypothetical protein